MEGGEAISHDTNWSSMNVILEKQVRSDKDSPAVSTDLECSMPLVRVACSTKTLLVCLYPPSYPPYQSLNQNLASGQAIAYFVGAGQTGQMMERSCVLTFSELRAQGLPSYRRAGAAVDALFAAMEKHLCTFIDFKKQSKKRSPCGTSVDRNSVSCAPDRQTVFENRLYGGRRNK
nr:unnamed protein product [Spirometra erinaceieuropaei]